MGDELKIPKDKRHRSSSSLADIGLDPTRSERKLDICVSIPELDDQFALADAHCKELQDKIDLVKVLKRKKKLKRRSSTKVNAKMSNDNLPFISVRTQPKKKVSQQAARLHRMEMPMKTSRNYTGNMAEVDHPRHIGKIKEMSNYELSSHDTDLYRHLKQKPASKIEDNRNRAEGDGRTGESVHISRYMDDRIDNDQRYETIMKEYRTKGNKCTPPMSRVASNTLRPNHNKRRNAHNNQYTSRAGEGVHVSTYNEGRLDNDLQYDSDMVRNKGIKRTATLSRDTTTNTQRSNHNRGKYAPSNISKSFWKNEMVDEDQHERPFAQHGYNKRQLGSDSIHDIEIQAEPMDERPIVELFNKQNSPLPYRNEKTAQPVSDSRAKKTDLSTREIQNPSESTILRKVKSGEPKRSWRPHVKYRSRRYELPTVASQMKQSGLRYPSINTNHTHLPFIVSKSTAPSHNIGVNLQQVLNCMKTQQPLSGIPLTMAHHMGLGHIASNNNNDIRKAPPPQLSLDNREMNAIKMGRRLLRLPSYKYISYNRFLNLYREGDGLVPKFLRSISKPHYFYTSMYNLVTPGEDMDGATSKGHGASQEAKQSLAEYASLYREYESVEKRIRDGEDDLQQRREELSRELALKEEYIRKVVQDYRTGSEMEQNLRASASTAENRNSTFKIGGD